MIESIILLFIILFILVTGHYIGTALALIGLAILTLYTEAPFQVIAHGLWHMLDSYTFAAIPLYFLLGEVIAVTGIAQRIFGAVAPLFSRLPGGLLQSNIGTCALFAAISGSSTATTAAIGSIAYDELTERGYASRPLIGSLAGGGTLGILIPPSTVLILYGALQQVSVGRLFVSGIVPGIIVALSYMVYIGIHAKLKPELIPVEDTEIIPLGKALKKSMEAWPFLILMAAVLGTVVAGLATATEAAAIGVIAALLLAAVFRRLTLKTVPDVLWGTLSTFSSLASIFIGAAILAQAVAFTGLPDYLMTMITEAGLSRFAVIALVYLAYLVLGCFFEPMSMMFITLPVVYPVVTQLGFDPVWFGIVMVMVIEIAVLTPPLGMNLFVLMAVSKGRHSLMDTAMAAVPYWLILLTCLVVFTLFPGIVLFLSNKIIY
jgi:C4-dicarboxylate transporter, DctM subunit